MKHYPRIWMKIKCQAVELLLNEKLDSWKQAICYAGYVSSYNGMEVLEYVLKLERSTIYRNAMKGKKIIEENEKHKHCNDDKITISIKTGALTTMTFTREKGLVEHTIGKKEKCQN